MARIFCIPAIILLFCALVLNFLVSISLPYLTGLDIARAQFNRGVVVSDNQNSGVTELRLGVWAPCFYNNGNQMTCYSRGHGYTISIQNDQKTASVIIGPSWTQGLAVHPVAAVVTVIALILSFFQHLTVALVASLVSFLAALLTLIAFFIDIALFAFLRHQIDKLPGVTGRTSPGPGFWLTFTSFILLILGGCTVCFGRRKISQTANGGFSKEKGTSIWPKFFRKK